MTFFPCHKERIPQFGDEKYPPTITAFYCRSSLAYGLQHPRSFLTESVLGFNHTTKDFRRNHITKGFWNHPQPKEEQQQSPHCTYATTAGTVPTHGRSANALAGFHHLPMYRRKKEQIPGCSRLYYRRKYECTQDGNGNCGYVQIVTKITVLYFMLKYLYRCAIMSHI